MNYQTTILMILALESENLLYSAGIKLFSYIASMREKKEKLRFEASQANFTQQTHADYNLEDIGHYEYTDRTKAGGNCYTSPIKMVSAFSRISGSTVSGLLSMFISAYTAERLVRKHNDGIRHFGRTQSCLSSTSASTDYVWDATINTMILDNSEPLVLEKQLQCDNSPHTLQQPRVASESGGLVYKYYGIATAMGLAKYIVRITIFLFLLNYYPGSVSPASDYNSNMPAAGQDPVRGKVTLPLPMTIRYDVALLSKHSNPHTDSTPFSDTIIALKDASGATRDILLRPDGYRNIRFSNNTWVMTSNAGARISELGTTQCYGLEMVYNDYTRVETWFSHITDSFHCKMSHQTQSVDSYYNWIKGTDYDLTTVFNWPQMTVASIGGTDINNAILQTDNAIRTIFGGVVDKELITYDTRDQTFAQQPNSEAEQYLNKVYVISRNQLVYITSCFISAKMDTLSDTAGVQCNTKTVVKTRLSLDPKLVTQIDSTTRFINSADIRTTYKNHQKASLQRLPEYSKVFRTNEANLQDWVTVSSQIVSIMPGLAENFRAAAWSDADTVVGSPLAFSVSQHLDASSSQAGSEGTTKWLLLTSLVFITTAVSLWVSYSEVQTIAAGLHELVTKLAKKKCDDFNMPAVSSDNLSLGHGSNHGRNHYGLVDSDVVYADMAYESHLASNHNVTNSSTTRASVTTDYLRDVELYRIVAEYDYYIESNLTHFRWPDSAQIKCALIGQSEPMAALNMVTTFHIELGRAALTYQADLDEDYEQMITSIDEALGGLCDAKDALFGITGFILAKTRVACTTSSETASRKAEMRKVRRRQARLRKRKENKTETLTNTTTTEAKICTVNTYNAVTPEAQHLLAGNKVTARLHRPVLKPDKQRRAIGMKRRHRLLRKQSGMSLAILSKAVTVSTVQQLVSTSHESEILHVDLARRTKDDARQSSNVNCSGIG